MSCKIVVLNSEAWTVFCLNRKCYKVREEFWVPVLIIGDYWEHLFSTVINFIFITLKRIDKDWGNKVKADQIRNLGGSIGASRPAITNATRSQIQRWVNSYNQLQRQKRLEDVAFCIWIWLVFNLILVMSVKWMLKLWYIAVGCWGTCINIMKRSVLIRIVIEPSLRFAGCRLVGSRLRVKH